uniref:Uncharacterized protein n=1 Tax=Arundo donax TaxID=35708 RepID=A0A0A9EBA3_ARUDO
MFSACAPPSG